MLMALIAAAALVPAAAPATAPPTAAPAAAPAAQPDPETEALARRLLDTIAAGDEAGARTFFAEAFAPESAEFEPREDTLTRLVALTRDSGGVDIAEWHPEGKQVFFEGRTRRGAIPVQGMVGVRGGRIMGFDLQRNPLARGDGAPAWPPAATSAAEAVAAIERDIEWRAKAGRFSGAVLVARRGEPVLERAWGLARRGPDAPATPQTLFTTASATKMLTSVAIGRLIDQGKLASTPRCPKRFRRSPRRPAPTARRSATCSATG